MNKDKLASSDIEKQNSRNSRAQKTRLDSYQLYVKLRVDPTKTNKKRTIYLEQVSDNQFDNYFSNHYFYLTRLITRVI